MINFDNYTNENNGVALKTKHNKNWPYIPDHPYRILIIGGSVSGKTNLLLNLIEDQPDVDKIYLYAKDPYEANYQYLIKIHKKVGIGHHNVEYSELTLSIQTICTMFTKILTNTIQIQKTKHQ